MNIKKQLKNFKPQTANKSIETYERNFRMLYKSVYDSEIINNFEWLEDTKKIFNFLDTININTSLNRIKAVSCVLQAYEADKELIKKYQNKMIELKTINRKRLAENKKTPKQEKNWMEWNEIIKLIRKLKKDVQIAKIDLNNMYNYKLYQFYVMLNLWVEIPVRNDFDIKLINKNDYEAMEEKEKENFNWMVIAKRKPTKLIILHQFKTSKIYKANNNGEPAKYTISPKLNKILNEWLKINKSNYLFTQLKDKNKCITDEAISKLLSSMFFKYTGKKISTTMLRHIKISHDRKGEKTIKEEEEEANKMLHTTGTNKQYFKN